MNEGVKILLERIKTNPEEFIGNDKWVGLIRSYKMYLNEEDNKALEDALNTLMQEQFTERVMKELLAPEEEDDLGKWFTKQASGTLSAGQTPLRSSVALSNTNAVTGTWGTSTIDVQAYQEAKINQMMVAHKAYLEQQKQKQHQTLFGRLKNYLASDV